MRVATHTVSVYSNALIEAAALGSLPVSWVSDIGRASMRQALGGLERFPLVDYGCAVEVGSPEEFLAKVPACGSDPYLDIMGLCSRHFPNDGKNAELVLAAIQAELR